MNETLDQISAALDEAVDEVVDAPESSADANEETDVDAPKGTKAKGKGAQARIQELVAARDAVTERLEKANERHETLQSQIDKLTEMLSSREQDARVVAKINELYEKNSDLKPIIEKLDKAIKGQPFDAEPVKAGDDKATDKALEAIKATREELLEQQAALAGEIADEKQARLVAESDSLINSLMSQLPDKYEGKDREVLGRVLEDAVNWEAIEANPAKLSAEIEKAFQETVTWYGDPRGALRTAQSDDKQTETKSKETLDDIVNKNWGKLKETGKDRSGRTRHEPAVSDADFTKVMGELLRRGSN